MGFNLFGSSKGDDNSSLTNQTDNSNHETQTATEGGIAAGGDVTVTDHGAIDSAFELATGTTDGMFDVVNSVISQVSENQENTLIQMQESYANSLGVVESAATGGVSSTNEAISGIGKMLVVAIVASIGLIAWGNK
ncbi:hypothetical protein [Reinekea thalattae]|uniref:Uncharacterized protein n=1 Tax=Reinekea thalattae TaxID=2593301 RepID=A0A5C8Z428_9GAMM|nr:hypothetical protein [Reinekea thalattae]TXR52064.1 hypothetical protein FME95_11655 [Reinekea thalattae]